MTYHKEEILEAVERVLVSQHSLSAFEREFLQRIVDRAESHGPHTFTPRLQQRALQMIESEPGAALGS